MIEDTEHVRSIGEHAMYSAVRTETLARWLEHAEQLGQHAIAAEIQGELDQRAREGATQAGLDHAGTR